MDRRSIQYRYALGAQLPAPARVAAAARTLAACRRLACAQRYAAGRAERIAGQGNHAPPRRDSKRRRAYAVGLHADGTTAPVARTRIAAMVARPATVAAFTRDPRCDRRPVAARAIGCGSAPGLGWNGIARLAYLLHAQRVRAALPPDLSIAWDGCRALRLPGGDALLLEGAAGFDTPVEVRARHGGERLRLSGRTHSHTLKHALQQHAVPPWQRERLPLLFASDGELLAAGDLLLSARLESWLRERGATLRWRHASTSADCIPSD